MYEHAISEEKERAEKEMHRELAKNGYNPDSENAETFLAERVIEVYEKIRSELGAKTTQSGDAFSLNIPATLRAIEDRPAIDSLDPSNERRRLQIELLANKFSETEARHEIGDFLFRYCFNVCEGEGSGSHESEAWSLHNDLYIFDTHVLEYGH